MYFGKRNDGFAYSVTTLFQECGCALPPDPDCLSQRLIALTFEPSTANWFKPVLPWTDYMSRLLHNLGIYDGYFLGKPSLEVLEQLPDGTCFLLGEVMTPIWDMTITQELCNNRLAFLVCKKQCNGYQVSNPRGCVSMICTIMELALLFQKRGFLFYLFKQVPILPVTKDVLIREAVSIEMKYNAIRHNTERPHIPNRSGMKASFWFGLTSYLQARMGQTEFFSLGSSVMSSLSEIRFGPIEEMLIELLAAESMFTTALSRAMDK